MRVEATTKIIKHQYFMKSNFNVIQMTACCILLSATSREIAASMNLCLLLTAKFIKQYPLKLAEISINDHKYCQIFYPGILLLHY